MDMVRARPRMDRLRSLAIWMIPPAAGWHRKSTGLSSSRLFLPLSALAAVLAALGCTVVGIFLRPNLAPTLLGIQAALLLGGAAAAGLTFYRIDRQLLEPLAHLRNWALRMRGGNLAVRIPEPSGGEFAGLARDINSLGETLQSLSTDLDNQVRKQTQRLAQKTHSLKLLYDVAASINMSHDLNELLTRFLYTLKEVVEARCAAVRLLTEDGQMRLVASIGLDPEVAERDRLLPANRCLWKDSPAGAPLAPSAGLQKCATVASMPAVDRQRLEMIAVPLQYQDRTLGVYNLFVDPRGLLCSDAAEDIRNLLTSIGRHLGMAIEKSRLDQEAHRLALMQERTRLATELHDSLAQTLASLRFQVKMLDETLGQGAGEGRPELDQIKHGLDQAYTELRELLVHFRAPICGQGLMPAIEELLTRFRRTTGIATFFQKECRETEMPANLETQVLRIVQEALANARKHSDARMVRVMLRCDGEGRYRVLVEDDGVGLPEDPGQGGHPGERLGLGIMAERARGIGGQLRVESEPGEGTQVLLTFRYPPLQEPQAELVEE